ncbi:MAG: hypothetical protein UIH99_04550 [Alphaproteobacteria bacterium]|jgi:hypothetical protein|nr:hypothetical protein [Alphaproteobacteria bacterium]
MNCSYVYSYDTKNPVETIPTDLPVFVMFDGYHALSHQIALRDLHKYANLLDKNNINTKLYCVSYTVPDICNTMSRKQKERIHLSTLFIKPKYFRRYIKNISDILIIPRIKSEQGKKLPVEVAEKNIRNITLFAYSYGAHAVNCLCKNIHKRMKNLNYTDNEIARILKQLVIIAQSPVRILYDKKFTTLNFVSAKDIRVLYSGAFKNVSKLTYYPEYNTMVQPQVFKDEYILEKSKCKKDAEHILWEYGSDTNITDYKIVNLLRTALCDAAKSEPITENTSLLQSNSDYSVQHIKNYKFFDTKNIIKSCIKHIIR